ncbi:MAG: 5-(carboxyamino)imidazole ribonucleotide synthase, partial [Ancrocorticia sp.]|uniref:5-(carboxyamino)imidazole ribonucleotide synthase n=1 Tax=Ancrocorticia sp. TaxID=2593684 RepID=UPI003F8F1E47
QDKLLMREKMEELGIPVPRWWRVRSEREIDAALDELGGRAILKTPRDGYDGKGVRMVSAGSQGRDWLEGGGPLLLEEAVDFEFEVAAVLARRPSGDVACWPVVRTVQQEGACFEVVAPAPGIDADLQARIQEIAERIAGELDVVGILAVELFVARSGGEAGMRDDDGDLPHSAPRPLVPYVNELAMRPHNSGHWTIEGADTSQFEQHLRAVLDLPLGSPAPVRPWSVMVNVLGSELDDPREAYPTVMARYPRAKIHMYGKEVKPRRKIGHVTVVGDDLDEALEQAHGAAAMLRGEAPGGLPGEARVEVLDEERSDTRGEA